MLHISPNRPRSIDNDCVPVLEDLLGYKINIPEQYSKATHKYYDFLYDVLGDANKRLVAIDWRWNPEDLFASLANAFPAHGFKVESSVKREVDDELEGYEVKYLFDDEVRDVFIDIFDQSDFIEAINKDLIRLDKLQLVDITGGDTYEWLVVGADFNEQKFIEYIDLEPLQEKKAEPKPKITTTSVQDDTVFYNPSFGWTDANDKLYLAEYCWENQWEFDLFTSRVYAGEDLQTTIKEDLKHFFEYVGGFEILEVRYFDNYPDADNKEKARFRVDVMLAEKIIIDQVKSMDLKLRFVTTS